MASGQSSWTPSSFLPSLSHPGQSRPPAQSRQTHTGSAVCRGATPEARSAARRVDAYPPVSAPDLRRPVARRAPWTAVFAERSAEASHPDAGPEPTAHAPDRFALLRRAKDLVVGLGEVSCAWGGKLPGVFCQFDKTTGWPVCSIKEDGGPVPDGICKIDETAARGISVRQLLVLYELVKRRCVVEGWTNWAGELLTPETVTLYDLNKYVIMPATKAHQCSYVELVTGAGEESARRCPDGHVPMARTIVYDLTHRRGAEEVSCTQCERKLELGATYWVCHRCGDRHKMCGACAPAPVCVKCAELQGPLWFTSHWYGRRRSLPQLADPRTHVLLSKQVGGARLQIHRVSPPARTRPVLHRWRRRLVARHQVLGVRVREQPARVRPL
jgi:hypothetical protein